MSKPLHIFFCDEQGSNIYYNPATKLVERSDRLPEDCRNFFVLKGDYHNDDGIIDGNSLIKFYNDFKKWNDELWSHMVSYDYYYNHNNAVLGAFNKNSDNSIIANMDKITLEEDRLFDKCNNGGHMQFNTDYSNQTIQCFSYDFSANYPSLMVKEDFLIPSVTYTNCKMKIIPKVFKLGIYKVKVSSNHPDFKKVFTFSKNHCYTNYSLNWALEIKDRFDVQFEIIDDDVNAFIYKEFVSGKQLFGKWYDKLVSIKDKHPKNKLVKNLLSSLWGSLQKKNTNYISVAKFDADIKKQQESIILEHKYKANGQNEYYEICKIDNLYKVNIRLKSFLSSYARVNISRVILDNIDSFVRSHTDSATFTREIDYQKYERLLPEDKTTGTITWSNVNRYQKIE